MTFDGRTYTGTVQRVTRALGLHTHLKSLYWGLRIPRLLYAASLRDAVVHEVNGTAVECPTETYWQYRRFRWMHPEVRLFEELVAELGNGDVFYDVGAHLGWHSLVAAAAPGDADVVAFEPHPETVARLETVIDAVGSEVDVRPIALGETDGTVEFAATPTPDAHVSGALSTTLEESITVTAARGDSLVQRGRLDPPDVLKIDAEGADAAVLRGLRETIETTRPRRIYCEVHRDEPEITALLDRFDYAHEPLASARPILRATPAELA